MLHASDDEIAGDLPGEVPVPILLPGLGGSGDPLANRGLSGCLSFSLLSLVSGMAPFVATPPADPMLAPR